MSEENGKVAEVLTPGNGVLSRGEVEEQLRTIITISVNGQGQLVIKAPLDRPELCLQALADTIKVVADSMAKAKGVIA